MKHRLVVITISVLAGGLIFFGSGPAARALCIVDPAGKSHWSALFQSFDRKEECNPWQLVKVGHPIRSLSVVHTNMGWSSRSRQMLVERSGRIAVLRETHMMSGEWKVDHEVHDVVLARTLLERLGPLASYNRYDPILSSSAKPYLADSPVVACEGFSTDSGNFDLDVVAVNGTKWNSLIGDGCNSRAANRAVDDLRTAFATVFKRADSTPAAGESFFMPLN